MHMDVGMDTGAMIDKLVINLPFQSTVEDLMKRSKKLTKIFECYLAIYAKSVIQAVPQPEDGVSYCQKVNKGRLIS